MTLSITFALLLSIAMVVVAVLTWFYHDAKHRDLDSWAQYGFSVETLRHTVLYYRSMGISMLVFYVLFTVNCLMLQSDGFQLFTYRNGEEVVAGPVGAAMFTFDLVARGGFFDVMEHFELSTSPLVMNRANFWFVLYCFVFRIYYALTLIRIVVSFVWIWVRIKKASEAYGVSTPGSGSKRRGLRVRLRSKRPGRSKNA
ncbi:MAG: hypothetical protein K0U74_11225 [Alphaproteobacteria bacterium]|nr:hypothetical protein [Alphaproteobacteria bacterium]